MASANSTQRINLRHTAPIVLLVSDRVEFCVRGFDNCGDENGDFKVKNIDRSGRPQKSKDE